MSESYDISTEKIGIDTEKIAEIIPEQIRSRGQRGPDKGARMINPNSLRNLKQYQNIPTEKTNDSDNLIWIVIGLIVLFFIIIGWRIYDWWKNKQES